MNRMILFAALVVGGALSAEPAAAQQEPVQLAQGVYIGPGGVGVDIEGRRHRRYYRDNTCERLRRACMYKEERGEEGMGNCRRYRRVCR